MAGPLTQLTIGVGAFQVASFKLPARLSATVTFGAEIVSGGGFQMGLMSEADYQKMGAGDTFQFYTACVRSDSRRSSSLAPHALV